MSDYTEFNNRLRETKIPSDCSPDDSNKLINHISNSLIGKYPAKLYKFRKCEELSINSFFEDEIWIPQSSNFNDPHDTLLYFDDFAIDTTIRNLITDSEIYDLKNHVTSFDNEASEPSRLFLLSYTPELIDLFRSLNIEALINLFHNNTEKNLDLMNSARSSYKKNAKENTYVSCFSTEIKSTLMWAHYADSSKGFAVEYNFLTEIYEDKDDSPVFNTFLKPVIFPVIYSNKRYDATDYAYDILNHILLGKDANQPIKYTDNLTYFKCALRKSVNWDYEHEWRMITMKIGRMDTNIPGFVLHKRPSAIYLGCNMSQIHKKIMIQMAKEKNIPVYQMYLDDSTEYYALNFFESR